MCSDWLKCVRSFARAARLQTGSERHTWRGSVLISSPHRSRAEGVWGRLLQSAGGCRSDNELFGEAQNPRFHIADSQTRRESSTRSRGVVEKRSKRHETQNRNLCKHKEKDQHCRQTSGVFFLFSLSQQLSQFLWFGSKASWLAEHKGLRCCGWESSEVHRGCSPDSSTVNKFLTGRCRSQGCNAAASQPSVFLPSPTLFQLQGSHCESLSWGQGQRKTAPVSSDDYPEFVCLRPCPLALPSRATPHI